MIQKPPTNSHRPKKLFAVFSFPYLQCKQIAGPYNVVRLADEIIASAGRFKEIQTDYNFYKVNSVLYPVVDLATNMFIEADKWYQTDNGLIRLFFPPIVGFGTLRNDCIYSDDCATLTADTTPIFYMVITQTDNPNINIGQYNQKMVIKTSSVVSKNASYLLEDANNFQIIAGQTSQLNPELYDAQVYWSASLKQFTVTTDQTISFTIRDTLNPTLCTYIARRINGEWGALNNTVYDLSGAITYSHRIVEQLPNAYLNGFHNFSLTISD